MMIANDGDERYSHMTGDFFETGLYRKSPSWGLRYQHPQCGEILQAGGGKRCACPGPAYYFQPVVQRCDSEQREQGLKLGLELLTHSEELWVMGEHISEGMRGEIAFAEEHGIPTFL